ncbi:GIY-YIG nuclease family protein [Peribacillus sp. NPDC046944]|uniref:GIY-YIG nuclease family protein n=1 Tax=unclassified Peribacillus TaxID=2675266 RepID=UPI00381C7694
MKEYIEYQYKNLPLTPKVCKHLILELFIGRLEMRQTIQNEVTKTHLDRGGKDTIAGDKSRIIKKALEILKKEGLADNPSYGYWVISDSSFKVSEETDVTVPIRDNIKNHHTESSEETKDDYEADIVLGEGTSAVYLYYLPSYQLNRQKDTWACKIGKTDRDPLQRILSQASTALPEKPKIAVIIKTNNSLVLEQAVHNILTYRNKKIGTALGKEWFDTNPDEFLKIVQFIEQSTLLF